MLFELVDDIEELLEAGGASETEPPVLFVADATPVPAPPVVPLDDPVPAAPPVVPFAAVDPVPAPVVPFAVELPIPVPVPVVPFNDGDLVSVPVVSFVVEPSAPVAAVPLDKPPDIAPAAVPFIVEPPVFTLVLLERATFAGVVIPPPLLRTTVATDPDPNLDFVIPTVINGPLALVVTTGSSIEIN